MSRFVVHGVPFAGTVSTRNVLVLAALAIALAACDTTAAPTSTTTDVLPPPDVIGSTSTTTAAPSPTSESVLFTYQGVLPDGTRFLARIPGQREETRTLITGTFNRRTGDEPAPVGEVRYTRTTEPPVLGYSGNLLSLWADNWLVEVALDPSALQQLATMPEVDVEEAILLVVVDGFPQLVLSEPFTWAGANPQIRYESFVVATGCWPEAAQCAGDSSVQVLSSNDVFVGGPGLSESQVEAMTLETVDVLRGALPDGFGYEVTLLGADGAGAVHITGDFVALVDGQRIRAGEVTYRHDEGQGTSFSGNHYLVTAGGWTVFIDFYQDVIDALGEDAESTVTESIDVITRNGFPVLLLEHPFSWDYERFPPQVRYGGFVVRRFCGELAAACSDFPSAQVIAIEDVYPGWVPMEYEEISITSLSKRSLP